MLRFRKSYFSDEGGKNVLQFGIIRSSKEFKLIGGGFES